MFSKKKTLMLTINNKLSLLTLRSFIKYKIKIINSDNI